MGRVCISLETASELHRGGGGVKYTFHVNARHELKGHPTISKRVSSLQIPANELHHLIVTYVGAMVSDSVRCLTPERGFISPSF